jgi:hypothetical protein
MFSLFDLCARRFTEINKTTQTSFLLSLSHKIFLFFSANPWKEKASRRAGPLSWLDRPVAGPTYTRAHASFSLPFINIGWTLLFKK